MKKIILVTLLFVCSLMALDEKDRIHELSPVSGYNDFAYLTSILVDYDSERVLYTYTFTMQDISEVYSKQTSDNVSYYVKVLLNTSKKPVHLRISKNAWTIIQG